MTKSDTYIQFIIDQLKSGNVERGKVMAKFGKKWQIGIRTFDRVWKRAQEIHLDNQQAINELKAKEYTKSELSSVKSQIKSKNERLLILQTEIEQTRAELERDLEYDYPVIQGKVQKVSRGLTAAERARLRDTLQKLQSEISKIEGDYAAVKSDVIARVEAIKVIRE